MRKVLYGFIASIIALILSVLFLNDWILKHNTPRLLHTIVYLFNLPDELKEHIAISKLSSSNASIHYKNEYYGRYALYISSEKSSAQYQALDKPLEYNVVCSNGLNRQQSGTVSNLPADIFWYSVPNDLKLGDEINCELTVLQSEGINELYLFANKLSDI